MRLCLLASLTVVCVFSQSTSTEEPFDPMNAHGGIFRALPWSDFEMAKISSMHGTADYHSLMEMVTEKLVEYADDLEPETRRQFERFLVNKRPPPVLKHMLSDHERKDIRFNHLSGKIDKVVNIIRRALERLPETQRDIALEYMGYILPK